MYCRSFCPGANLSPRASHVSEVEGELEEPGHLGLPEEVVDAVEEDVDGRGARGEEGDPLPVVVLGVEHEVRGHDGRAHRHDHQDQVHQQHEAVHEVEPAPQNRASRGEYSRDPRGFKLPAASV